MATSHSLAVIGTDQNLGALLKTWKPRLAQIYGEGDEAAGRFLAIVDACVRRNPDLKNCTVDSFRTAIENAAAMKLLPTGLMNLGWIIPFKDNRSGNVEATFIAGYRGLLDICYRSGRIAGYHVALVHKDDGWRYVAGLNPVLEHEPRFDDTFEFGKREDLVAGYAVWWDVIGGQKVAQRHLVLNHGQLERLRLKSKRPDSGPWKTDYEPMALKSIVRASTKLMPLTPAEDALLAQAYESEDRHLGLPDQVIDVPSEVVPEAGRTAMFEEAEDA